MSARALASECAGLLEALALRGDDEAEAVLRRVLELLREGEGGGGSESGGNSGSVSPSSLARIVRMRDTPSKRTTQQSKSINLPGGGGALLSGGGGGSALAPASLGRADGARLSGNASSPPSSPALGGKQRSGSVWAPPSTAGGGVVAERKVSAVTPTLGRHKSQPSGGERLSGASSAPSPAAAPATPPPGSPPVAVAPPQLSVGPCEVCKRTPPPPPLSCSECGSGVCSDISCSALYTLKSLGETEKRLICKLCIEVLKRKARPNNPPPPSADEATNPMFHAARRRGPRGEGGAGAGVEVTPPDDDDPFEDFSWSGDDNDGK